MLKKAKFYDWHLEMSAHFVHEAGSVFFVFFSIINIKTLSAFLFSINVEGSSGKYSLLWWWLLKFDKEGYILENTPGDSFTDVHEISSVLIAKMLRSLWCGEFFFVFLRNLNFGFIQ